MTPRQATTFDGTLYGAVDGANRTFTFAEPTLLLYAVRSDATGMLLFRNGLLIDEYADYAAGRDPGTGAGYFSLTDALSDDIFTAVAFARGPTKSRYGSTSITADGLLLRLSPLTPEQGPTIDMMLFHNGQLLTLGLDYTLSGIRITLIGDQAIIDDDTFLAVIGMGGTEASTFDGLITGTINGSNAVFGLPGPAGTGPGYGVMLFHNGQFLTEGTDYTKVGTLVTLLGAQIPQVTDTLTARVFLTGVPSQISTANGSLVYNSAAGSILFMDGLLLTQPAQGVTAANTATLATAPTLTDVVTALAWTPNLTDPARPALNLSTQYSTDDGSISGVRDTVNRIFTIGTTGLITQLLLFYTGNFLRRDVDYLFDGNTVILLTAPYPGPTDRLTAEVWSS